MNGETSFLDFKKATVTCGYDRCQVRLAKVGMTEIGAQSCRFIKVVFAAFPPSELGGNAAFS